MAAADRTLIVGAGIVGQVLACALAKRGFACEIVEIKPDFEIAGAGMIVQGTGLRAMLDIGVVEDLAAEGWYDPERAIHFLDTLGKVVLAPPNINIVGEGYPATLSIRRQAVHEVLNRHVRKAGVPVRMGTTVETLDDRGDAVDVVFADGTGGRYDLVVGCDGLRSGVRALTFPGIEPEFAGFCNWRLVQPRPAAIERPTWSWGHGKTIGILPVNDSEIYIAGVGKAASAERPPQETVADTFRRQFACFGGPVREAMALDFTAEDILYTVMEQVKLPPPWYRGRVVIMGDAAHAACPFWAQGGAMGIGRFPCPATAWCVVRTALTLCPGGKAGVVAVFGLTLDLNGPKDAPIFRASGWIAGRSGSTGVRFKDCFLELSRAQVPDPASRPVRFEYQRSDRSVVVPRARRSGLSQPHLIQA